MPVVWFEGGSGGRGLYADHQDSIVVAAHPTNGYLAINGYDPWGIPNAGNQGRFGYTGQAWIPELGMWYYKARFYSPTTGRFMQVDPIGYEDQMNLYAYVGNDPVNASDPTGLCETRTGSNICERTATRVISTMNGDEIRTYSVKYFARDGAILNVRTTSEGIGESYADPMVLLGGIASGVRALVSTVIRGGGGRAAAGAGAGAAEGGTAVAISAATKFSVAETRGLRSMMGSGETGAQAFLQRTLAGGVTRLPDGVTRTTLERYIVKVIDAGPRTSGAPSQQMRVQAILKLLERMP